MKRICGLLFLPVLAALLFAACTRGETEPTDSAGTQSATAINIYINTPTAAPAQSTQSAAAEENTAVVSPPATHKEWLTLEISMPDANGMMTVDTDPANKFTQTIVTQRKLDAALLVAVYSLPDTGQNYVVEFDGSKNADGSYRRTAETFRRLYLIDENGKIDSVASVNADETENISSVENWFCVNVFIKGLMLPKIEDAL